MMITGNALIITGGILDNIHAKTAHGLIRGSDRFNILGVVDHNFKGKDAGDVIEGKHADIPIYGTVKECKLKHPSVEYAIIGIATKGGMISPSLFNIIKDCLNERISIVNGLHQGVADIPELVAIAHEKEIPLYDIRKPRPFHESRFWNGEILTVTCPKIAVLGTDCAMGKRTTTRFLLEELQQDQLRAEMIYTGQTGWMQGSNYGLIFDAMINDFISGEVEGVIVKCFQETNPDIILIEGQSGLRNPSGPCGSEFIISARLDGVILQHNPKRIFFKDFNDYPAKIPTPAEEIKLISDLGAKTIGLAINTADLSREEAEEYKNKYEEELGIPVVLPLYEGVGRLADACKKLIK